MSLIKLLLKLAIVGLIANATWQVGSAYAIHYRFVDSVRETTQFRGIMSDEQVQSRVLELATVYGVPLTDEMLTVRTQGEHTIVDGAYNRPIEVIPRATYTWPFKLQLDTFIDKGTSRTKIPE